MKVYESVALKWSSNPSLLQRSEPEKMKFWKLTVFCNLTNLLPVFDVCTLHKEMMYSYVSVFV